MLALFILAAVAYGAASFAYGVEGGADEGGERRFARFARPILAIAAVLHFAAIGAQCVEGDHPLKNIFLATSFGTLLAVFGYLPLSRGRRLDALGPVMAPVGLVGLVVGVLFSGVDPAQSLPVAPGVAGTHVAFASAGLAGFTLAAGVAGLYLAVERRLRRKTFRPGARGMSLAGLDRLHHRLILLVTPVLTIAIATGVLWILRSGGPQMLAGRTFEILSAATAWVASVALLVSRAGWGIRGRSSAWMTLTAFAAMILIVISYGVRT